MNSLKENWFSEIDEELWPGHCFSLKCDQLLYNKKSKYQDVLVFNKFDRTKFIILI
jgi:spermidine synthase